MSNNSHSATLLGQVVPCITFNLVIFDKLFQTHLRSAYILELVAADLGSKKRNESCFALTRLVWAYTLIYLLIYFNSIDFVVPTRVLLAQTALCAGCLLHLLVVDEGDVGLKKAIGNH